MRAGLPTDRWKKSVNDYITGACELFRSMRAEGFLGHDPIPVDQNGELLNGAHRVACALALGIEQVPVMRMSRMVWAPPWHREWFLEHGMSPVDLARLDDDWELMQHKKGSD